MSVILLTGASGAVGAAVLAAAPKGRVVALSHRGAVAGRTVAGDITATRLGLDRPAYAALADEVDTVVHCAGATDFTAPADELRALNVDGARHVVAFAADARARLLFASTAFVTRHAMAARMARPYLETKLAAEQIVRAAALPGAIARIAVVMGDSRTGWMSRFQGLHSTVDVILRNLLPVLPFAAEAPIDALPCDVVARAMLTIADGPLTAPPRDHWLTAGDAALTIEHMVDLTAERGTALGLTVGRPRFVGPALIDRVVRPVYIDPLPPPRRRKFDNLMSLASLFDQAPPFPSTLGELVAAPTNADLATAFAATVDFLAARRGLVAANLP